MSVALDTWSDEDASAVPGLHGQPRPRVLIATTVPWFASARLALAFADSGFAVDAICPPHHPLAQLTFVRMIASYPVTSPLAGLRRAIAFSGPDLVVPCDDRAAKHLRQLQVQSTGETADLLARSVGAPEHYPLLLSRSQTLAAARAVGVRVPDTARTADRAQLRAWLEDHGFPAVLKTDGSWGGSGVRVVQNHAEAERAFAHLVRLPSKVRALKRLWVDHDGALVEPWRKGKAPFVNVQSYVDGATANVAAACRDGEILSQVGVAVMRTAYPLGPATVVRCVECPEMASAARRTARALGLSGLCGFDFIIDAAGAAHLIEVNPRATPTGHFPDGHGLALPAALGPRASEAERRPIRNSPGPFALFPQEIIRDEKSGFVEAGLLDLPTQSPELTSLGYADWRRARNRPSARIRRFSKMFRSQIIIDRRR